MKTSIAKAEAHSKALNNLYNKLTVLMEAHNLAVSMTGDTFQGLPKHEEVDNLFKQYVSNRDSI